MKPTTAHVKGTDLVTIKAMLTRRGLLLACTSSLSTADQAVLDTVSAADWVANAPATSIMEAAARVLHPDRPDDLEQLGRACAEHAFSGIYKAFLRIASLSFLLRNVPLVWSQYHSTGHAELNRRDDTAGAELIVTGAGEVSVSNLRLVSGFSARALEMAGAKDVTCRLDTTDPERWRWCFAWRA